jgi:hypothetical protein
MASTKSLSRNKKSKGNDAKDSSAVCEAAAPASIKPLVATNEGQKMSESILTFSENIANAEAPAPLPAGEYTAEIRAVDVKVSQKGNKYAAITFYIPSDQYPADFTDGDPDGMTLVFNRLVLEDTVKDRHRIRKFCEAIGAKMGSQIDVNDWVGLTATVSVKIGEWEGEARSEIDRVLAP